MGVSSGRGGDGLHGDTIHRSIYQETADNPSGEGGLLACLSNVHGGGDDDGDNPDGVLVG